MIDDLFDDLTVGRHIICSFTRGPSPSRPGASVVTILETGAGEVMSQEEEFLGESGASSSRLELLAIEAGLKRVGTRDLPVTVASQQRYIADHGLNLIRGGLRRTSGATAANVDVWQRILDLNVVQRVEWRWISKDDRTHLERFFGKRSEREAEVDMRRAIDRDPY